MISPILMNMKNFTFWKNSQSDSFYIQILGQRGQTRKYSYMVKVYIVSNYYLCTKYITVKYCCICVVIVLQMSLTVYSFELEWLGNHKSNNKIIQKVQSDSTQILVIVQNNSSQILSHSSQIISQILVIVQKDSKSDSSVCQLFMPKRSFSVSKVFLLASNILSDHLNRIIVG